MKLIFYKNAKHGYKFLLSYNDRLCPYNDDGDEICRCSNCNVECITLENYMFNKYIFDELSKELIEMCKLTNQNNLALMWLKHDNILFKEIAIKILKNNERLEYIEV